MNSLERLYLELRNEEENYFYDLTQIEDKNSYKRGRYDMLTKVLNVLQPYVNNKNALKREEL